MTTDHSQPDQQADAPPRPPAYLPPPPPPRRKSLWTRLLLVALAFSVMYNFTLQVQYEQYFQSAEPPHEKFDSGDREAGDKIALIEITATIMPPYTEQAVKAIRQAKEDDNVKGVVLVIDSPGGLVADSHRIYHELQLLREKKPMAVSMQRIAASGGYYVAMGAGPKSVIYVEPTTWTGSIGVIIPRFDASGLAEKVGIQSDPLVTGPYKDALSPFRPMTPDETAIWKAIIDDSFDRFVKVIADNREKLDDAKVRALATGQVYTADGALKLGMVDKVGYKEDAIAALQEELGLAKARVVKYSFPSSFMEILASSAKSSNLSHQWQQLLELTVPKAMYLCSELPTLP